MKGQVVTAFLAGRCSVVGPVGYGGYPPIDDGDGDGADAAEFRIPEEEAEDDGDGDACGEADEEQLGPSPMALVFVDVVPFPSRDE